MRRLGIGIVLLGLAAATWFTWLERPESGTRCDREPNLIVATTGADRTLQLEHERECRRLATVEVAKGVGVGSALVVLGLVVVVVSPSRRRVKADRVNKAASAVSTRERRSEDGTQWWDGYRWLRIERDE